MRDAGVDFQGLFDHGDRLRARIAVFRDLEGCRGGRRGEGDGGLRAGSPQAGFGLGGQKAFGVRAEESFEFVLQIGFGGGEPGFVDFGRGGGAGIGSSLRFCRMARRLCSAERVQALALPRRRRVIDREMSSAMDRLSDPKAARP